MLKTLTRISGAIALTYALTLAALAFAAVSAQANTATFNRITDHFNKVKSMTGSFVQLDPRGNQVTGKFYIDRPGKMRFDYEKRAALQMIADGKSVVVHNKKLKTWDIYPLSKTPLNLLLGDRIRLDNKSVKSVKEEAGLTIVTLGDKSVFGDSLIKMMFDSKTYDLRQWNIIDEQGGETQVLIFDVREGVRFADNVFKVNYARIDRIKKERARGND